MIRLFIAIDFPKEIKSQLADLVESLIEEGYPLVFEKEENFHLTLKFLGWCQEKKLSEIEEAIKKATTGVKPFLFQPTTIGYFLRESLILWVGVQIQKGLSKLVNQVENELSKVGFTKEKREFSSHVTLGKRRRVTPLKKWREMAEEIKGKYEPSADWRITKFKVKEIVLMESTLSREGSIYTPIISFPLKS